ncbi:MAG: acyltransferase family protein [Methyloprofundus sp.]
MIPKQKKKQTAFEIFRALAVTMVLVEHFSDAAYDLLVVVKEIAFAFGYYGIPLFFIISGFLLTASLFFILNNKHCSFTRATGLFLEKRILRIYPAYLVSLIISDIYLNTSGFAFLVEAPFLRFSSALNRK